jgi:3-hydroxyacyl-[acyl-carrier-protein] dehydratase
MPGVLMLQALVEASAWLIRITEDFRHSVVVLRETKGVKYGSFMEPGRQMHITTEMVECDDRFASFKGRGEVDRNATVSARLTLCRYNLSDRDPTLRALDERMVLEQRSRLQMLRGNWAPATCAMSSLQG